MDITVTNAEPRREFIRVDFEKQCSIREDAQRFANYANDVLIPALNALSLCVTKDSVIDYALNPDFVRLDYIKYQCEDVKDECELIRSVAQKEAERRYYDLINGANIRRYTIRQPDSIKFENSLIVVDEGAIKEMASIYVEGAELVAYDRHQAAVKALNEFFKGHAPDGFNSLCHYFPVVNGVVKAGTMISYKQFI